MTRHDQSPANLVLKGLRRSVNTQISRFGAGLLDVTSREIPCRSAESARLSGALCIVGCIGNRGYGPARRRTGVLVPRSGRRYPLRYAHATGMTGQAAETVRQRLTCCAADVPAVNREHDGLTTG